MKKKVNKKPYPKKLQFELWDMQNEYGLFFDSEIECYDYIEEGSDYTKPFYYLILKGKKLIKSVTHDRGAFSWTKH